MTDTCLFCAIASGGIPADVVLDEPDLLAFRDISPQAPVHVLVIPKTHQRTIGSLAQADPALAARLLDAAVRVAEQADPEQAGYRLVVNTGVDGGQTVDHAHIHVLCGRPMHWPPG